MKRNKSSRNNYYVVNPISQITPPKIFFQSFDVIVIHYSLYILYEYFLPDSYFKKISSSKALKIQFIQDEYREVYALSEKIADLGIDVIFTLYEEESAKKVYDHPRLENVKFVKTLTGYVPDKMVDNGVKKIKERQLHIGYRARPLPYWLGRLGQEKKLIAEKVSELAIEEGLDVDISWKEEDRIYGKKWADFYSNLRATLLTEGGSSITDKYGDVKKLVDKYIESRPGAAFEEVHRKILYKYENNIMYNTISPRIFEAAAFRTPMVAFPGGYEGVIKEDRNYIRLEKDFSNFATVAKLLRDNDFLQDLADRTYNDLISSGSYGSSILAERVDGVISDNLKSRSSAVKGTLLIKSSMGGAIMQNKFSKFIVFLQNNFRKFAVLLTRLLHLLSFIYPIHEMRVVSRILREKRSWSQKAIYIIKKGYKYVKENIWKVIMYLTIWFLPLYVGFHISVFLHLQLGLSISIAYILFVIGCLVWPDRNTLG